jgi:hypothetical protein
VRVLRPGGLLWVKVKDDTESGKPCWMLDNISTIARAELGLEKVDIFFLCGHPINSYRWKTQKRARKDHSFLVVFRKPKPTPRQQARQQARDAVRRQALAKLTPEEWRALLGYDKPLGAR